MSNVKNIVEKKCLNQIAELLKKNLISPIDAMNYAQIIESKSSAYQKKLVVLRVNSLYEERIEGKKVI